MVEIPESHQDLLNDDVKAFAFLATIMKDGTPQVTPLWFNFKDGHIYINSARGRTKDRNMRARPFMAIAISDPKNPYRYVQIRGKIVEISEQDADMHINTLSEKYNGLPYPLRSGEVRVIYKIEPLKVSSMG